MESRQEGKKPKDNPNARQRQQQRQQKGRNGKAAAELPLCTSAGASGTSVSPGRTREEEMHPTEEKGRAIHNPREASRKKAQKPREEGSGTQSEDSTHKTVTSHD